MKPQPKVKRLPQSLPSRIVAYFRTNPDEDLTVDDLMIKFGLRQRRQAHAVVTKLVMDGELEREPVRIRAARREAR